MPDINVSHSHVFPNRAYIVASVMDCQYPSESWYNRIWDVSVCLQDFSYKGGVSNSVGYPKAKRSSLPKSVFNCLNLTSVLVCHDGIKIVFHNKVFL